LTGTKLTGYFSYLNHIGDFDEMKSEATDIDEFASLDHLQLAMSIGTVCQVAKTVERLVENEATMLEKTNDLFALEIERMATMHMKFCMFQMMREKIEKTPFKDERIRTILELLAKVFALKELKNENQMIYEAGFFT
jgi:hypothetical protein